MCPPETEPVERNEKCRRERSPLPSGAGICPLVLVPREGNSAGCAAGEIRFQSHARSARLAEFAILGAGVSLNR